MTTQVETRPPLPRLPVPDRAPLARKRRERALLQVACLAITAFMAVPMYLIALAAFSSRGSLERFPKTFLPTGVSTDTLRSFLGATGVVPSFLNSVAVGLIALVLSLAIGTPAGYAIARYTFAGRDSYQLFLLFTRALPVVVLSVPLAQMAISLNMSDSIIAVALLHTAFAVPTTVLITASIFAAIPRDVEEAALVFGCTPPAAFRRVIVPLALPGIAASSVFTFILSWNEVLGAAVLTLTNRTLPAQVLASLQDSPLAYRFAGGFALVVPALVFVFFMRRYMVNMWGTTLR